MVSTVFPQVTHIVVDNVDNAVDSVKISSKTNKLENFS